MSFIQNVPIVKKTFWACLSREIFITFKLQKWTNFIKHMFETACKFYKENVSLSHNEICKVQDLIIVIIITGKSALKKAMAL